MRNFVEKAGRAVVLGLLFFGLRLLQLRSGFDPETGLALPSAAGTALAACLAAAAALEALLALRLSKEKIPFRRRFAPVGGMKMALVMGAMLLIAGSALMAACAVIGSGIALGAAGLLGAAAGVGVLLFTQQTGRRVDLSVMPLLPAMFFAVFLVLAEYLPEADNPVLAGYYIPVLAAAMTAYAFSQLAAALCIAAAADGLASFSGGLWGISKVLVYAGCALTLLAFLALQRRERELPPEEAETREMEDEAVSTAEPMEKGDEA